MRFEVRTCLQLVLMVISSKAKAPLGETCNSVVNVYNGCKTPTLSNCESNQASQRCQQSKPIDCQDVKDSGNITTGVYIIYPKGTGGIRVLCDMTTDGGGWTVIQRRVSKSDFNKNWLDYQTGFGDFKSNFWLGNLLIHFITIQGLYELRIDMIGPDNKAKYAKYDVFSVGDARSQYQLLLGKYSGNAGDSFSSLNGMKFSTKDSDNDAHNTVSCAVKSAGAWWYRDCHMSNLNGIYGSTEYAKGITWKSLTTYRKSLKQVQMKVKRWSV